MIIATPKRNASVFKFLSFQDRSEKRHRFRDGLLRTVSLPEETKLRFHGVVSTLSKI